MGLKIVSKGSINCKASIVPGLHHTASWRRADLELCCTTYFKCLFHLEVGTGFGNVHRVHKATPNKISCFLSTARRPPFTDKTAWMPIIWLSTVAALCKYILITHQLHVVTSVATYLDSYVATQRNV